MFFVLLQCLFGRMKENQQIEFKQSWRDEYLQYICGFANAQGGYAVCRHRR